MLFFRSSSLAAQNQEKDLASLRQYADLLGTHSGVGLWDIVIKDGDPLGPGSVWNWSPEFLKTVGFTAEEFPPVGQTWIGRLHPEDSPQVLAAFGALLADTTGKTRFCMDQRLKMRDGTYRWFNGTGGCLHNAKGVPIRAVGSYVDITDRKTKEFDEARKNAEFQEFVEQMNKSFVSLASGKLNTRMQNSAVAHFEPLVKLFNESIFSLEDVIGSVIEIINSVGASASEINSASGDLAMRTEQQAAALEETVASLGEISKTVSLTSASAEHAKKSALITAESATKGGDIVSDANRAMQEIEESSKKISNIIGVIDEIAFQTTLLALNAGVEAARAGEAGRGFAVVAQEVRNLALRSADSAKEIKALISTSASQVANGVRLVTNAGDSLGTIVKLVDEVSRSVAGIADSSRAQADTIREITTTANQIDSVTQQNAAMVEETRAAAQSLENDMRNLRTLTSRFSVTGAEARKTPQLRAPAHRKIA